MGDSGWDPAFAAGKRYSVPAAVLVLLSFGSVTAAAQGHGIAAAQPTFEVATVKAADPGKQPVVAWAIYPGGRVVVTNYSLAMLVQEAFGAISDYRVTGGQRWVWTELYDVAAKAPPDSAAAAYVPPRPTSSPPTAFLEMMQTLLADRFGLKVHHEARELPAYVLSVAAGGSRLTPARDPSGESPWRIRNGDLEARNKDIAWLASWLERRHHRPVIDHTGLTGTYDFELKFEPGSLSADIPADVGGAPPRPLLTIALETQLGLTFKLTKALVEIIVIDDARRPDAN